MNGLSRALSAGRMQALRVHAYGAGATELRAESARVPVLRAPDDVLVRVHASSLNPLDVAMIGGYGARILNAMRALDGADVEFPLVVGRDFVGEVAAAGAGCRLRVGQRVWGVVPPHRPGAHAQYVTVRERWAGAAPRALGDAAAGGALYAALSACAVLRAGGLAPGTRPRRPPRVLLLGLGGVGHVALQLLVDTGAEVVVGCSGDLCASATSLGAVAALDRTVPDYDRLLEESGPYAVILDCAGLGGAEAGSRRWRFSRFVTLSSPLLRLADAHGLLAGPAAAAVQLVTHSVSAARVAPAPSPSLSSAPPPSATAVACPPHVRWAFFSPSATDIEMLRRLAERGKLCISVERVFPWWEGVAAYERAARGSARGKVLLDFTAPAPAGGDPPPAGESRSPAGEGPSASGEDPSSAREHYGPAPATV